MLRKRDFLDMARDAGYEVTDRLLVKYQEYGLLGRMTSKARRRGGEGLWHPNQGRLWLYLLRQRETARPMTLANVPVGLWILGAEGIELPQVRRVLAFWAGSMVPERDVVLRRSRRGLGISKTVDLLSTPANRKAKRELRGRLEVIQNAGVQLFSEDELSQVILAAMVPPQAEPTRGQRDVTSLVHRYWSAIHEGLSRLDFLCSDRSEPNWRWVRDFMSRGINDYVQLQPLLASRTDVGRLFEEPAWSNFFHRACPNAVCVHGLYLSRDAPPHRTA